MKESEKAQELVEKFYTNMENTTELYQSEYKLLAKQCAFICVEEILFSTEHLLAYKRPERFSATYWKNVKTEIEKL